MKMPAKPLGRLKYFEGMKMMNGMMKMNGDMNPMDMKMTNQQMDMNTVMYPEITGEEYGRSKDAPNEIVDMESIVSEIKTDTAAKTTLRQGPERILEFELTGNMNRYVWTMDNKTVSETDKILIKKGENVKIILYNNSMMRHPMHLHGHDFRVINGQGEYAPLK